MSEVIIQFLGSGDAFGSGGRLHTCICVDTGDARFLVDCGASSLTAMKRWHIDPGSIDMIFITHLHGDHFGGIPFFILDAQLITKRTRPLVIAGPPGLKERVRDTMEVLIPGSSRVQQKFAVDFRELPDREPATMGPVVVTPYQVVHPCGAPPYALRIECGGKVLAYSGDTEWTDSLIDSARGADLFICEAYFFEKNIKYHLDYRTLMEHREELGCGRLIVTHMSDDMLGRLQSIEVEYAEDGKRIFL